MLLYSTPSDAAVIAMLLPLILMGVSFLAKILFGILFFTRKKKAKRTFGIMTLVMPVVFVLALLLWEHFRFK